MRKLVLLVVALGALAIAVPAALPSPTSDSGCTEQHVSGAACQGPDADAAANACQIYTWVDNASCTLTVPDGVASNVSGTLIAYSEFQGTDWHAEFDLVVRDASTQAVLYSNSNAQTVPITERPLVPSMSLGFGSGISGGGEVVCEVTGTHNPAGAAMSGVAATAGIQGVFNNSFGCVVN
jgi:hypothetical protein